MAARKRLFIPAKRGDTLLLEFSVMEDGEEVNLSEASARMQLRDMKTDQQVVAATSVAGHLTLLSDGCEGGFPCKVQVSVPYETMEAVEPGQYLADVEFTFPSGVRRSTYTFVVVVEQDYTYDEAP